jgi:hypothetical protein
VRCTCSCNPASVAPPGSHGDAHVGDGDAENAFAEVTSTKPSESIGMTGGVVATYGW